MISVVAPGSEGAKPQRIAVSYSAVDMAGRERASEQREFAVTPQSDPARPLAVNMQALAHLPPGRYAIVVRSRVVETGSQGQLFADLTVPDYRKNSVSLSGVLMEQALTPPALPADALRDVLDQAPTTERTFSKGANVSAMIRLYKGATPISENLILKTTILDSRDHVVFSTADEISMSNLPTQFTEHRLPLPKASLAPGQYLLRFEIERPSSDRQWREVRFEVK